MRTYSEFIAEKEIKLRDCGVRDVPELNPMLFDFQRQIVSQSLRKGRYALFCDCGLGKTPMQLEWAAKVPGKVLILAPLAVAQQTVREGKKFGHDVRYIRSQTSDCAKIHITNYEMLEHFYSVDQDYDGVVLDESSILKSYSGAMRNQIISTFERMPYRLACTATPAPNDYMELGNHSEFLGALTRTEMLSTFFVHDGGDTSKWRLKRHAERDFWKWVCSWAVMARRPSDLGFDDGKFILPELRIHDLAVQIHKPTDGDVQFLGLSDSYEQFYQAVRRCWRFGQQKPVDCYIVTASNEGAVTENIKRKERDADKLAEEMIKACQLAA